MEGDKSVEEKRGKEAGVRRKRKRRKQVRRRRKAK